MENGTWKSYQTIKVRPAPGTRAALVCGLLCIACLHSPPGLCAQDFSSIDSDLQQLESLIHDTLSNMETQQRHLNDLKRSLNASAELIAAYENIINERETSLRDLQARLNEMSAIYQKQSALSAKYEKSSKFWRTFTLIAAPTAALFSGGIVYAVTH